MTKRVLWLALIIVAMAAPARAQLVVVDPGNLEQTTLIAERTLREYQTLWAQYQTIVRMAQGLGNMDRYRLPSVPLTVHEPSRWQYGAPWLQGLNGGDLRGQLYRADDSTAGGAGLRPRVTAAAGAQGGRDRLRDDRNHRRGRANRREPGGARSRVQRSAPAGDRPALQDDVLNPRSRYHELTALLDKVAAGALLARRQDNATNQLLSHVLEQLLVRGQAHAGHRNGRDEHAAREPARRPPGRRQPDQRRGEQICARGANRNGGFMTSRIRLIGAVALLAVLGFGLRPASAFVVTDPATTAKNILTAVLKSQMVDTLTEQGRRVRRMARRLSAFADLGRYLVPDAPRWRSYRYQDVSLYATAYEDALEPRGS